MNNINFLGYNNFPLSSDTLAFVQEMITHTAHLTAIGGKTYILSGCEVQGDNVAAGWLVVNGELLPFVGGAMQATIYIKEVRRDVDASGYHFAQVYKMRTAEFGIGVEQYPWADFKKIETNTELSAAIVSLQQAIIELQGTPKGVIAMWHGEIDDIPLGWHLCNGLKGTPDLQGRFIAGYSTTDDDYPMHKKGGSKEVTLTKKEMPKHSHQVKPYAGVSGILSNDHISAPVISSSGNATAEEGEGMPHENRPPYYVLAYIMKM